MIYLPLYCDFKGTNGKNAGNHCCMVCLCTSVAYTQVWMDFCVHVCVYTCAVHQHPERVKGKNKRRLRQKEKRHKERGGGELCSRGLGSESVCMFVFLPGLSHTNWPWTTAECECAWVWVYTVLTWYCKSGTIKKLPLVSQTLLLFLPLLPFFPVSAETNWPTVACDSIWVCVCLMPHITSYPAETTKVIHPGYNRISLLHIYTHTHTHTHTL